MTAAHAPLDHFPAMVWLLKELAPEGIELREHHLLSGAFHSFTAIFARGQGQVRFTWDAGAAVLSIAFREDLHEDWTHDANISLPNGEGLYAEIASQATEMLAV